MKYNMNSSEIIIILNSLLEKYLTAKDYFKENSSEEDIEGVISPAEIELTYNKILKQAQEQGECTNLKPIGTMKN